MKIKVRNTTKTQLDWLVAKIEGLTVVIESVEAQADRFNACVLVDGSKPPQAAIDAVIAALKPRMKIEGSHGIHLVPVPSYSTNWSQGGPILTEARISRTIDHSGLWVAYWTDGYGDDDKKWMHCDRSELIAGFRCFVASKLGDEVEIPEELK